MFFSFGEVMVMMITGIRSSSQVENIYAYGNSHYNQVQNTAVSPITRVRSVAGLNAQEEELKFAATYQHKGSVSSDEETVALKEKSNLAESYMDQNVVQYNVSNPYEQARMSIENTLLSGMYFDMMA